MQEIHEAKVNKHLGNVCCGLLKVAKSKWKKKNRKYSHKNSKSKHNYQYKGMGKKTKKCESFLKFFSYFWEVIDFNFLMSVCVCGDLKEIKWVTSSKNWVGEVKWYLIENHQRTWSKYILNLLKDTAEFKRRLGIRGWRSGKRKKHRRMK